MSAVSTQRTQSSMQGCFRGTWKRRVASGRREGSRGEGCAGKDTAGEGLPLVKSETIQAPKRRVIVTDRNWADWNLEALTNIKRKT